ncbi:MAG TPA: ergothioneine biosynthesis protein EgtB [Stellaceae bacterium]
MARADLRSRFAEVRAATEALAAGLTPEDQTIQSMPDVSPTKWHLAHTSWFFETFLLGPHLPDYRPFHPAYGYLFNSYYEAVGERHPRPARGLLSRPSADEIGRYRHYVTGAMERLLDRADAATWSAIAPLLELGIHHEQQHQELVLMDIKHVFSVNPLLPAYRDAPPRPRLATAGAAAPLGWVDVAGGVREIGHGESGFAFDNEGPRHKVWTEPYRLADRLVTCGEYLAFIEDCGYRRPEFWLSDGWAAVQAGGWSAPLYWRADDGGGWSIFTLAGERPLDPAEPVCHVSFYEADAYAKWAGCRLPTEAEWEVAAVEARVALDGNLADKGRLHPAACAAVKASGGGLRQMIGDAWEWTASAYAPYPGFRAPPGAVGEYNGKFMCSQMVLRGGAAVTPPGHIRTTYRNFFPPPARWAFSGVRLAKDLGR